VYTQKHDVTARLQRLLNDEKIRTAVLRASVDTSKREPWYARQIKDGVQVVICHPKHQTTNGVPRISRVLVATDFSPQASNALEWARSLAGAFGAKLVLLHVVDVSSLAKTGALMAGPNALHLLREQAQRSMDELKARIPDADTVIREGSPSPVIVDAAVELQCQMIVMGTHGRSGLAHFVLGSVAEYVVRNSNVPVLTIRTH